MPERTEFHTEAAATLKPWEARLRGHEGPTTDWCWKSVENVPGCGSKEESGGKLAERRWECYESVV